MNAPFLSERGTLVEVNAWKPQQRQMSFRQKLVRGIVLAAIAGYLLPGIVGLCYTLKTGNFNPFPIIDVWWSWIFS